MAKSKKLQERPLEVQSNSQGVLGYTPPPKESLSRYKKLLKPGKLRTKKVIHKLKN
jgi:hypothetical protein